MESILTSIKKLIGPNEDQTHFDNDIIMHINSVFMILNQLGVGTSNPFYITGATETWDMFFVEKPEDIERFNSVITFMYLKVKLVFDPPQTGPLVEAMERSAAELEWRLEAQTKEGV